MYCIQSCLELFSFLHSLKLCKDDMTLAQSLSFADETVNMNEIQWHSVMWLAPGLYKLSWRVSAGSVRGEVHLTGGPLALGR